MPKNCERCGGVDTHTDDRGVKHVADFVDYCADCQKNLCSKCMEKGCCGHKPALSGMKADFGDDADE